MMFRCTVYALMGAMCVGADAAVAQHDPQRNATQGIAAGDWDKAQRELARAEPGEPETHFVRMMLALKQGDLDGAVQSAGAALEAGLPFTRLAAGPRELLGPLHQTEAYKTWAVQHGRPLLVHGPMVGAVTGSSAAFWVRTAREAQVQVRVGDRVSSPVSTTAASDFTASVRLDGLEPQTQYGYEVLLDGQAVDVGDARFATFPKQGQGGRFAVAFGGGAGYVPEHERMWDTIRRFAPAALLMLGDNVYIDQPQHLLCQHYCYYRRQSQPAWRRLVASTAVFAIYDDHDFGTDDCVPGPEIESPPWKRVVWNVFRQNWVNPGYGGGESQPGCWFDFYIGDVHFIMLDGRYYRDLRGGSMLGPAQKTWLLETLKHSRGTFKILASPVPWSEGVKPGSRDPWDGFPDERRTIFAFLESHRIDGVFLIAADRHRTDLRKTERPGGYDLFELESSRLTNRHTHGVVQTPGLMWGYNQTCSFALLRFDTLAEPPRVAFECIDIDGRVIHQHELRADQLRHP